MARGAAHSCPRWSFSYNEAQPGSTGRELLERLQEAQRGEYPDSLLRTVQRRVKVWRRANVTAMVFRRIAGCRVRPGCRVGPFNPGSAGEAPDMEVVMTGSGFLLITHTTSHPD